MSDSDDDQVVCVRWLDAFKSEHEDDGEGLEQSSVGYLIEETPRVVRIAQSWNQDAGYCECLHIPRAYVVSIAYLATLPAEPQN